MASARVAQGIEHRIPNPGVARSIRAVGTNKIKGYRAFSVALFIFLIYPVLSTLEKGGLVRVGNPSYLLHINAPVTCGWVILLFAELKPVFFSVLLFLSASVISML